MRAPQSERNASELPAIAADILERLRERRPRVHCITNAVAQNFTANVLLAAGAVPSMTIAPKEVRAFAARADALLINLGTFDAGAAEGVARARSASPTRPAFPGCSIRCSSTARRRARRSRRRSWRKKPRALRLNARRVRRAGGRQDRRRGAGALRQGAAHRGRPDRRARSRCRRRAPRHDRQRPSADGAGHRDGLRGLGAGRRRARGRARRLEAVAAALIMHRRRGRNRGRARARPRQLRHGNPRCAVCARPRHADRKSKGELMQGPCRSSLLRHRRSGGGRRPRSCRSLPRCWRPAARRWCSFATSCPTRASWSSGPAPSRRRSAACRCVINDRVDVALAIGCRRRAHRLGRHGAGRCAAPARSRRDHRAHHQQPAARRRAPTSV